MNWAPNSGWFTDTNWTQYGGGSSGISSSVPSVTSVATPPPSPPHLQFSANVVGTVVPLVYGTNRPAGQIIWAAGIDATSNILDSSTLTFTASYGEPADPTEPVRVDRMWANGTLFYDVSQGGVIPVANLTTDDQAALKACIDNMEVSLGGPAATPSAIAERYLGAGNVPAYRRRRTITFPDFPLVITNNSIPNVSVEWVRTDTSLVNVADAMEALLAAYLQRIGWQIVDSTLPNYFDFAVSGIDDVAYGFAITDQSAVLDILVSHAQVYRYQVLDAPVRLVRRPVDGSLSVDLSVNEADCIRRSGPTIRYNRVEPTSLPVGIDFSYFDPANYYDTRVQQARHEGSSASNSVASMSSVFIVEANVARDIVYDALYDIRSKALTLDFELDDIRPQPSDVIDVTTVEGDVYTCLVEQQTYTKTRSSQVSGVALLTSVGIALDSESLSGITPGLYWPEGAVQYDLIVTPSRIWSNYNLSLNYNTNPPARRLSGIRHADYAPSYTDDYNIGRMFEDNTYVYWLDGGQISIWRCRKDALDIDASKENVRIPAYIKPNHSHAGTSPSVVRDGKLYVAWDGLNGDGSNHYKLVVVDLVAWDAAAYVSFDWWTDIGSGTADNPAAYGLAITDNGTVLISGQITSPVGRLYYSSIGSLASWAHVDLSVKPGFATSSGNTAYFTEYDATGSGVSHRTHQIVVVDCSGAPSASVVDLTAQDSNIVCISQRNYPQDIFCSPTHLFVPCNYTRSNTTDATEYEYLARLDHGTLAAAGGKFIGEMTYASHELFVVNGRYFNGQMYLPMWGESYDGRLLVVNEDLSSPTLYPTPGVLFPVNDAFTGALNIYADETKTGNLFYGSTESGEPVPGWAASGSFTEIRNAGHSVWYSFVAATTDTFTVTVSDYNGSGLHSVQVFTGASLGALTEVVSTQGSSVLAPPTAASFSGTAGTTYMIAIRHDETDAFPGFAAGTPFNGPDAERLGKYAITLTGSSGGGGGSSDDDLLLLLLL